MDHRLLENDTNNIEESMGLHEQKKKQPEYITIEVYLNSSEEDGNLVR